MCFHQIMLAGDCSNSTNLVLNAGFVSGTVAPGSTLTSYYSNGCGTPDPTCGCNKKIFGIILPQPHPDNTLLLHKETDPLIPDLTW